MTTAETVGMRSEQLDRIEPVMQDFVDTKGIRGIHTLVSRRGELVHSASVGHRDAEAGEAMTADTIFRIYSMTKPVVSTALMVLFEEGRFLLEDPVAKYLPAFGACQVLGADGALAPQARPMTVRDLLMHTSGLTYDFHVDNPVAQHYRDARVMHDAGRSLAECVDAIAAQPLAFQPGERWHYSVGIDVAGRLIELLADQSLGDFLAERFFDPLGMPDTGFGVAEGDRDRLAAMYGLPDLIGEGYHGGKLLEAALSGFNERIDVDATYPVDTPETFQRGGVGLFSTGADYLRFARMLGNGGELDGVRVIGPKTLELMHANALPDSMLPYEIIGREAPGFGFGLGSRVMVDVALNAGPGSVGEFGWAGAAKTYFWVDPAEQLVGVLMTQYMTGMEQPERVFRNLVYAAIAS